MMMMMKINRSSSSSSSPDQGISCLVLRGYELIDRYSFLSFLIGFHFQAEFMGKPKQRHVAAKPASKKNDSDGEDGWVIVKKQRVTILVPPLPVGRMLDPGPSKPDAAVPVKAVNHKSTVLIEATTNTRRISLVDELEKLAPMAPNRGGDSYYCHSNSSCTPLFSFNTVYVD
ncbi:hypothetical protein NC652_017281 [Populus alba x Populus x berolinensis]|nr:hypothetical protein NC652_017281 [Populus alba x Populus x berolinensis]